jgi:hypothetical protein
MSPGTLTKSLRVAPALLAAAVLAVVTVRGVRRRTAVARERAMVTTTEHLRAFDADRRQRADFAQLPGWDQVSGPDPYLLREIPGSSFVVAVLRGADAVVVLDRATMQERQRLPAPRSPTALAVTTDRAFDAPVVFVAGELSTSIARFRWTGAELKPVGSADLSDVRAIRGLAAGALGRRLYAVEEQRGRLIALELDEGLPLRVVSRQERFVGNGPVRIEEVGDRLIVDCLLDHALVVTKLERDGRLADEAPIRIAHDGPIWGFAARESGPRQLLIAAGGAEDHPLDRTIGAFGYVDSFLYLYRVDLGAGRATREAAIDLGDHGVVIPKALALRLEPAATAVRVSGYGSDRLLEVRFDGGGHPAVSSAELVPGTNAVLERADGALLYADPLLDAWVVARPPAKPQIIPVPVAASQPPRDPSVRLGEALIFTTLIAPWNRSDGPLSRFTCETCHFEGYGDGRIHHTGRGDVHAVTKPLLGLFNNRPHFSRALDPDLTSVAFNEFRVAGLRSDHDPWFTLRTRDFPWLRALGVDEERLSPERLRQAFMSFLMAFNHRPNPATLGRDRFSPAERAGAAVFRDRCESCHQARLASDDPATRVPFERWEALVMSPRGGPIVWGEADYEKTGVVPYVHPEGARVPSLRRLYKKHPYFTNGSAPTLAAVLERVRFTGDTFWHEDGDRDMPVPATGQRLQLDDDEREALLAFLGVL